MASIGACIFKNVAALTGIATLCVVLTMLISGLRNAARSRTFQTASFIMMMIALACLLTSKHHKSTLSVVFASTLMALLSISSHSGSLTALKSLVATFVVFSLMAIIGYGCTKSLASWQTFLIPILLSLVVLGVLNLFVRSSVAQNVMAFVGCIVFSLFVVFDVNRFARFCQGEDCCTRGTTALWLDFVNLFNDILSIQS